MYHSIIVRPLPTPRGPSLARCLYARQLFEWCLALVVRCCRAFTAPPLRVAGSLHYINYVYIATIWSYTIIYIYILYLALKQYYSSQIAFLWLPDRWQLVLIELYTYTVLVTTRFNKSETWKGRVHHAISSLSEDWRYLGLSRRKYGARCYAVVL